MQVFNWGFMQSRNNWGSNYIWSMKPVNEQSGGTLIHKVYCLYSYAQALGNKRKWVWTLATQRKILNSLRPHGSWWLLSRHRGHEAGSRGRPRSRSTGVTVHFLCFWICWPCGCRSLWPWDGDRSTDPGAGLASAPHSSWTLESRCYSKSEGSHCRSKESHSGPACRPGEAVRIMLHSRIAI